MTITNTMAEGGNISSGSSNCFMDRPIPRKKRKHEQQNEEGEEDSSSPPLADAVAAAATGATG